MTETALHGRVSEFGRARGRALLKMAGHRPCFVYAWRRHCTEVLKSEVSPPSRPGRLFANRDINESRTYPFGTPGHRALSRDCPHPASVRPERSGRSRLFACCSDHATCGIEPPKQLKNFSQNRGIHRSLMGYRPLRSQPSLIITTQNIPIQTLSILHTNTIQI